MQSQDVATRRPDHSSGPVVDVEQAEAALVEHYPRLVRLAYLVLPPGLGRNRRVLTAHALTQRALPRSRTTSDVAVSDDPRPDDARNADPAYTFVRGRVLRTALEAGLPLRRLAWPKRAQLPPVLPHVWGLRLFPRSGGADELALDQRLSGLSGAARAAYVLRGLERLPDDEVRALLAAAGAEDPDDALDEADEAGGDDTSYALLASPEFDPCSLQARPTDLMRRRQHMKAGLVAAVAALVCGALLGLPGDGWGPDGAAAPPYARNPAGQAALDPARLTKVAPTAWKDSARTDYSVWPARGSLTGDKALLRRALAVWARPGGSVQVSATPGTAAGAPPGPAQLLYAGEIDQARVVLLYDGLRIVRYAEPKDGTSGAALDFARVDGATGSEANAVVAGRADGNVRYLTAPWVTGTSMRDLLKPDAAPTPLRRSADGVTDPLAGSGQADASTGVCASWNALEIKDNSGNRLMSDLGELTPAHLTAGKPGAPREATSRAALASWAQTGCSLAAVRGHGVRTVNAWEYARQTLPETNGTATWLCTRADTWRGVGSQVLAQVQAPGKPAAAVAAQAEDSPACGTRDPRVLAGVLWKSEAGAWYLLAAATDDVTDVTTTGDVKSTTPGNTVALPTKQNTQATLVAHLPDGREITSLH
ncbi:hypothetical protein ACIQNU_05805 [Streptomyces sp. NPDC091292]|uniref:hypothetical protein n=1 Tax=Streptomyces sp. NPDC091292 TaxID=3365991 RepID=UPI0037F40AF4